MEAGAGMNGVNTSRFKSREFVDGAGVTTESGASQPVFTWSEMVKIGRTGTIGGLFPTPSAPTSGCLRPDV